MAGKSEYRNSWIAEKLDRINLTVPKGKKEHIRDFATMQGESINGFINRAIDETMEREQPGDIMEYIPDEAGASDGQKDGE